MRESGGKIILWAGVMLIVSLVLNGCLNTDVVGGGVLEVAVITDELEDVDVDVSSPYLSDTFRTYARSVAVAFPPDVKDVVVQVGATVEGVYMKTEGKLSMGRLILSPFSYILYGIAGIMDFTSIDAVKREKLVRLYRALNWYTGNFDENPDDLKEDMYHYQMNQMLAENFFITGATLPVAAKQMIDLANGVITTAEAGMIALTDFVSILGRIDYLSEVSSFELYTPSSVVTYATYDIEVSTPEFGSLELDFSSMGLLDLMLKVDFGGKKVLLKDIKGVVARDGNGAFKVVLKPYQKLYIIDNDYSFDFVQFVKATNSASVGGIVVDLDGIANLLRDATFPVEVEVLSSDGEEIYKVGSTYGVYIKYVPSSL